MSLHWADGMLNLNISLVQCLNVCTHVQMLKITLSMESYRSLDMAINPVIHIFMVRRVIDAHDVDVCHITADESQLRPQHRK